jgi:uncharacterized protein
VSGKLIAQFATNLEALISGDATAAGAGGTAEGAEEAAGGTTGAGSGATTPATSQAPTALPQQEDSLNLIKLVGGPLLKRIIPVAAGAAILALLGRQIRRLFRRNKS